MPQAHSDRSNNVIKGNKTNKDINEKFENFGRHGHRRSNILFLRQLFSPQS